MKILKKNEENQFSPKKKTVFFLKYLNFFQGKKLIIFLRF